jgi:hypothetical protein
MRLPVLVRTGDMIDTLTNDHLTSRSVPKPFGLDSVKISGRGGRTLRDRDPNAKHRLPVFQS